MKHYSLVIEEKLVNQVDELIKKHGLYASRSDFIRDAIRQRLIEIKRLLEDGETKIAIEKPENEKKQENEHFRGVH
ncbi:MAG: ribbon-helix-helix domain-containing protein [archaeon]|nr:ribbon-helix-helix domain-containing protein [archaeon]